MRPGWATLVCLIAAACGGIAQSTQPAGPKGSATVVGTINGQPVPANDAMWTQGTTTTNGVTVTSGMIDITSIANACPCATAAGYATVLVLTVGVLGTVLPTGVYSFPSSVNPSGNDPVGDAHYVVNDPGTTLLNATSGSITISQASASTTVGSFDVVFPMGDHLTGTFSAPTCAAAEAADAAACP